MNNGVIDDFPDSTVLPGMGSVEFGAISPGDQALIQTAVGKMSPETSRRRFFTVRHRLSDLELHRLTDMDGWDRFAIGAAVRREDGSIEGVGVARFHRLVGQPHAAEIALVVVDEFQRKGIGKRLLESLALAARKRGIRCLRGLVMRDNAPMLDLLSRHAPGRMRLSESFSEPSEFEIELDA